MTGTEESGGRSRGDRGLRRWTVWLLFFSAVFVVTFPGALLGLGQFYLRDFHPFFYPQKFFLAQALNGLAFQPWLPHVGCGVPFFASLQPGVAYPPSLLLVLTGSFDLGLKLLIGFHFFLAFVSAALLTRFLLRAGLWVSCLCGTAYSFGGYLVSSVSQLNNLQSAAWAPLVLLLLLRFSHRPTTAGLLWAALAGTMQFLGGGVEVTALTMGVVLFLSAVRFVEGEGRYRSDRGAARLRRVWQGPLLVVVALLFTLALSAFQILPTIEMAGRSSRAGSGLSANEAARYSLLPGNLKNITVPRRIGDPGQPDYFKAFPREGVPWLLSIYQGVVVTYLALIGLLTGTRRTGLRLALLFCAVGGIILALGNSFAFTSTLFTHLPGAGWFRYPEKFLFLTGLTVPLLAALGCGVLTTRQGDGDGWQGRLWPMAAEVLAFALPLAILVTALSNAGGGNAELSIGVPILLLAMAAVVRLLAWKKLVGGTLAALLMATLVAADLSTAHRPLNALVPADFYRNLPQAARLILGHQKPEKTSEARMPPRCRSTLPGLPGGPPATERPTATPLDTHLVWRAYLSPNSAGLFGISQVRGSTGMELRMPMHRERMLASAGLPDKLALLSLWGVTWLVMDRELACPDELDLVSSHLDLPGQRLYRLRRTLPRLFLIERDLAGEYAGVANRLQTSGNGMSDYVEALRSDLQLAGSIGETVRLTAWSPSQLAAEVVVEREGMLLAVTEGFDPGWMALVNDSPATVHEGLGGFSLIQMPGPGRFQVDFRYRPSGLFPGALVSLSVLFVLILLTFVQSLRTRRGRDHRPG